MTVVMGPPGRAELLDEEQRALGALADAGLVPPLRLVPISEGKPFGHALRVV